MSAFISASEIEAAKRLKKEQRRAAREEILREAKENYEREKKRQELKRERGEDVWVAPAISKRLGLQSKDDSPTPERKKRRKYKKEHKKHKKHKTKKSKLEIDSGSSSAAESESGEEMWIEKGADEKPGCESPLQPHSPSTKASPLQREDWMTMPLAPSDLSMTKLAERREAQENKKQERKEEMIQLQCFSKPGQHPRELNPYWKDGGSGLPQHKPDSNSHEHPGDSRRERPSESTRERSGDSTKGHSGSRVGDGGRSWMLRSYKRAVQQAETEGRSLEQIAAERWGSLEKLHSLLRAAGIDPENPDHPPKTGRREYLYSAHPREEERRRKDWKHRETPSRLPTDHKSSREVSGASGFLKPGEADMKLSSRRSEASSSAGRSSSISQGWRKRKEAWEDPQDEGKKLSHDSRSSSPKEKPSSHLAPPSSPQKIQEEREVESPSTDVPSEPVTDSQLNAIGAKLMKAELMGDSEKAESLKKELAKLRKQKELQESGRKGGQTQYKGPREETTIVLTKTDRFGRTRPVELPSTTGYRQPGPSKTRTHSKKGKREKYFADDDEYNLKSLMEQERQMTAEETHAAIARMASKFVPASNMDETVDDAFDSKAAMRFDPAKEEEKRKQRAILESRKMAEILENCYFCFDSPNFSKHLLVAIGISTYLSVPFHQSLTEGHCLIVPMEHTVCSMQMDENVWSEVRIFQKGLTRMFADHDMDVVFMETYSSTKSKSHMSIECIPVPREEGELAPMYFKKAILESDEEWSQNKKLIDTRQKGVRNSIPSGLPYFFVEFGMDGGYGHIIEDQTKFPHYFGREVVGGLVDAEPRLWLKPHKESFETQKQKVLKLSEWWKPYDWTQKLKEK